MHRMQEKLFSLGVGALLVSSVTLATAQAADLAAGNTLRPVLSSLGNKTKLVDVGEIEVFVRLQEASVVEWRNQEVAAGRGEPDAAAQQAYAATLRAAQESMRSALSAMGADVLSQLRVGDNGIRIRVDVNRLDAIRALAGVSAVSKVTQFTPDLARSVPWINASAVQAGGNTGDGVVIAVIDTGVDYLHANLGGAGDPAEYAANDTAIIEPGSFPTAKVIGGYDLAGPTYDARDPASVPEPDPDPLDVDGHGSHVSGIAAGFGVPGSIGVGVAPGAKILALKVFGDVAGSTSLVSDAIEMALDPNGDGDISDHVDVINMSLGSGYGTPDDPSAVAANNAAELGVVVVASAGNAGNIPYITGSPAVADKVVSVASSLSGGETLGIDVNGSALEAVEGTGAVRITDGAVAGNLAVPSDPANFIGCNPIADDLTGAVALISRGVCSFDLKYINAQAAGAVAIVVYNDGAAPDRVAPIIMGGVGNAGVPITIPGVMVSSFDGRALADAITGGTQVATLDADIRAQSNFGDTVSSFSSRGPGHGGSTFKPDLTAPGDAVVSTGVGSGTGASTLGGTSMAAPHVAGVAALLLSANHDLTPTAVKAIMQNSTVDAVPDGLIGPAQSMSRVGTGVVRADKAVALSSYVTPGGVSFGRVNPSRSFRTSETATLVNLTGDRRSFNVTHVPNTTFPGVEVSCPDSVDVHGDDNGRQSRRGRGRDGDDGDRGDRNVRTADVKITLRMNPAAGVPDNAFLSQTEVDGWCVLNDGKDEVRVAYLAVVDPASRMRATSEDGVLTVSNSGDSEGVAEGFTLVARDGLVFDNTFNSFHATGFRSNSFAAEGDLIEFGVASEAPWENFATAEIDFLVDVDGDNVLDSILVVADFFEDGAPITAIFPQGAALFNAGVDYNDAATVLTFFGRQDSPLGFLGFLPPGDTDFRYVAVFFDVRTGEFDIQEGDVDLAQEIVPAASSFRLPARDRVTLPVDGEGDMLWLFQNNEFGPGNRNGQAQVVTVGGDD